MDNHLFDNLTKRLAAGASRRSALKALVGAVGLTTLLHGDGARAQRRARCRRGGQTCGETEPCCIAALCCNGVCCDDESTCLNGECCNDLRAGFGACGVCCPPCHICDRATGACRPCGECERCDARTGACFPKRGRPCGLCEDCDLATGRCVDNKRCVCQADQRGGGGTRALVVDGKHRIKCGSCETCDPDTGCVPTCADPCAPCDATTGACVPVTCGACEACVDGACEPKLPPLCGACEEPLCDASSQEYVCSPRCELGQVCCGGDCHAACTNGCARNEMSCECDAVSPGQVYCATSNECAANPCLGNQFFNIATCECQCTTEPCSAGETRNAETCACEPDSVCPPGTIECGHDSSGTPFCHSTSVGTVVCCPREGDGGYACVNAVCCGGSCCSTATDYCAGDVCCPNGWQVCGGVRCCPEGCCGAGCCNLSTQLCCNGSCTNGTQCP